MNRWLGVAVVCLAGAGPMPVSSCTDGVLFSCPIGDNHLAVCALDGEATYSFGPLRQPELVLSDPFVSLNYHPWIGMGRWQHSWVSFPNGEYEYVVSAARDRLDEERLDLWEVGVRVSRDDELLASLTCETTFAEDVLAPLSWGKVRAGLRWSREHWRWQLPKKCADGECAC